MRNPIELPFRSGVVLLGLALPALLGVAPPEGAIMESLDRATAVVVGGGTREEKLESLKDVSRELLATDVMGRAAMGPLLDQQSAEAQAEFLRLFDEVIVRAYVQKLLFFRKPRFEFIEETRNGDAARVQTKIVTSKYDYFVDYALRRRGDAWIATDVTVEGVSLTGNYAEQFRSLLRTRSFEDLLELMRRKVRGWRGEDT